MGSEVTPLGLERPSTAKWYLSGWFVGTVAIFCLIGLFFMAFQAFVVGPGAILTEAGKPLPPSPFNWFPGWFGAFNAWLLITVTAIPYAVAFSYVLTMRPEKRNRLHLQLKNMTPDDKHAVDTILDSMFRMSRYVGSAAAPTIVTFLGATAILLFKPVIDGELTGLDLSQGANMLLLGYGMADIAAPEKFGPIMYWSMTGFCFGFLGAWLYFVIDLTRSFFNCDLRPRTLMAGAIRMSVASVIALVTALALQSMLGLSVPEGVAANAVAETAKASAPTTAGNWLVAVAFMIGFFPQAGFGYIKSVAALVLNSMSRLTGANSTRLTELPGMSYSHSERLRVEGIDAVENLAGQHPILLTLQTGFTYAMIEAWIGEAWLRGYLGKVRHAAFVEKTGLRGKYELRRLAWRLTPATDGGKERPEKAANALEAFLLDAMDPEKKDHHRWKVLAMLCLYFDNWGGEAQASGAPS